MDRTSTDHLPLTILTGALGAGKTTLLNAALRDPAMARTAVIVNEFGDVGIDQMLIEAASDDTIELAGGCLCCAVRGAFTDGLTDLLMARRAEFDRIVVETSGLAAPGPILAALHAHPFLSTAVRPSGIVCLVDVTHGVDVLDGGPEAAAQVALADRIVLTKTDVKPASTQLTDALREHAPAAEITDVSALNSQIFAVFKPLLSPRRFVASAISVHAKTDTPKAVSLSLDHPLALPKVEQFLDQLISRLGPRLLRVKGLVWTADLPDRPLLVQGVGQILAPFERLNAWPAERRATQMVVITRGVDAEDVQRLFASFTDVAATDLPDAEALTNNPLAVPGVRF
ncbi:MAG: GTP-binding protein [Pseudomonadota bacterium]